MSLKSILNQGLSTNLKLEFSKLNFLDRKEYKPENNKLNPYWISGFIDGDGSFFITINNQNNHVSAWLSIGLSAREKLLLDKIQNFFSGKGGIYFSKYNSVVEWKVFKIHDLVSISSHFESYPLIGLKLKKFEIWKEILPLIENKFYLTQEGLTQIKSLNNKLKAFN